MVLVVSASAAMASLLATTPDDRVRHLLHKPAYHMRVLYVSECACMLHEGIEHDCGISSLAMSAACVGWRK